MITDLTRPLTELPDPLPVPPIRPRPGDAPLRARVTPPGSKSLTNRLLLLAALCEGESVLRRPLLTADDAQRMLAALALLGAPCTIESDTLHMRGVAGCWLPEASPLTLDLNNAGTATRFLSAAALLSPTPITITGNERMRQRPIAELVTSLRQLGAKVEHTGDPSCPPITITPPPEPTTRVLEIPTTQSSQFISALLLIAPWMPGGLTLKLLGPVTSASYVRMTLALLEKLEVECQTSSDLSVIQIPHAPVRAFTMDVEPDASGATYFWGAGALIPGASVTIPGLDSSSFQGDTKFPDLLARMGAKVSEQPATPKGPGSITVAAPSQLQPIMADMSDMPDAAMTIAALAAFAPGPSVLHGVRTLRVKETDRIAALQNELGKIGVTVHADINTDPDTITITPPQGGIGLSDSAPPVTFDTYDDHRMAMSLALIALRRPNVSINDPACVAKTYPPFWADLSTLYPTSERNK
ncbi:MAG: 3-phosphoshikimate 1-carboxyvinyltransferase [Phycisphaerales bacterium JB059]